MEIPVRNKKGQELVTNLFPGTQIYSKNFLVIPFSTFS